MEATCGRYFRSAIAVAFTIMCAGACAPAGASPGATVYPGMQIYQGGTACMVGFVEPRLRVALSTGQCDEGSLVTDRDKNLLGTVVVARRQTSGDVSAEVAAAVEYEVIAVAPDVAATDLLPTGRHLHSTPALSAQQGLPVCQFRVAGGQKCGTVGPVSNGRFVIADMAVDSRDFGGPVYALTDDNGAMIVGLYEGMWRSAPAIESWQAVMAQVYIDTRARGGQQPLPGLRPAGR
ncbi:hypothetical protein [Mycobacterium sp. 852002-51057_SCH5723018]|uniref:Rv1815 family serine proteinase n=1 Tax=Mycobacterium sp. 852002-51057_SCH5723018 TaxID=1834094 RepID=UPI0007FD4A80|nr:hypothetical protein A5764_03340 [Mycobacterium sp. 852002-51057_SCH5723018]